MLQKCNRSKREKLENLNQIFRLFMITVRSFICRPGNDRLYLNLNNFMG